MRVRRMIYGLCLAATLGAMAGCGGDNGALSVETDEPLYREGQQLEKQGRTQEALVSYLKLISRRGDQAPESHLEAGLISLENIKDPIAAIYHFRRYLELEPNSHRAPLVREELDRAMREFASTLPAQHWESIKGLGGAGSEEFQKLETENAALKAEIATLRGNASVGIGFRAVPTEDPAASPAAEPASPALVPVAPAAAPAPVVRPAPAPAAVAPARSVAAPAAATASAAHPVRMHTVSARETLYSLALRYYGTRSRWKDIRDANRDKLKGEKPTLSIGMQLKIP